MSMKHLEYTKTGRKFNITGGQRVYKGGISQLNILDAGEYKPYVWNSQQRICKFNKYEFHLVKDGIEIWEEKVKLTKLSMHPEVEIVTGGFERKESFVSRLQARAISNLDSADKIEISYNIETEDFKASIFFDLGGARTITFGCALTPKVLGKKQRLVVEFDQELTSINYSSDKTKKSYWAWLPYEDADHRVSLSKNKLKIYLREKVYNSFNIERIRPDTWGPITVAAADDGYEFNNTTWYDDDGFSRIRVGQYDSGQDNDAGLMWTVTDADLPGATIDSGTKITVNVTTVSGDGVDGALRIVDDRTPGTWGSTNRPSQQTLHPDTIDWDVNSTGSKDSPATTNTLMQARIDGNDVAAAFQSGDKVAWIWLATYNGEEYNILFTEANATLTIVYTPGGWSGKINGVTEPAKVMGVEKVNIKSINGVE